MTGGAPIARLHARAAVSGDASHHFSDALTSGAAFVGIATALWGGPGWESADDWAALVASAVIDINAIRLLRPAIADLMDRAPDPEVLETIREVASAVPGVLAIEKLAVRRVGLRYRVVVHVQDDPDLSLRDAHHLGGIVSAAIHADLRQVQSVTVHMEPFPSS